MTEPKSTFFDDNMGPDELAMIEQFLKIADPAQEYPDAQIHLCALARLAVQLRDSMNREQWSVMVATGGLIARLAKNEVAAGDQFAAFISKLKGE